jgi:hypothetical protein
VVVALALTTVLAVSADAALAADHDLVFPAGTACDFDLAVDVAGGHQVVHTFLDANGNTVRTISTGVGSQLTFTNLATTATLALPANGAVTNTVINADGSQTVTLTGHNVLILFPTDVPAGPSTTLYVGRVVFTIGVDGVFTLRSTSGRATDICAALS